MTKMLLFVTIAALFSTGCGTTKSDIEAIGEPDMVTISGQLTYLPRIALIPGGTATITVSDVSLQDVSAPVLGETVIELEDQQVPIGFELTIDAAEVDPRNSYAVSATIHDPEGGLEWISDTSHLVDLQGSEVETGQLILTQVQADPPTTDEASLVGEWSVTAIDGTATSERSPTMVFEADGSLNGQGSCNSYGASYRTDGMSLAIESEIMSTLMACEEASMAQEQAFLTVMNEIVRDPATFGIEGDSLTITTTSGATITATR